MNGGLFVMQFKLSGTNSAVTDQVPAPFLGK